MTQHMNNLSFKRCCTDFYQTDLVRLLFGDSMHPGGLQLTKELGEKIMIKKENKILDLACGLGTTDIFLAKYFGCHITGIDLAEKNICEAKKSSIKQCIADLVDFQIGDVENIIINFRDEIYDCVVSECSFCLFQDKMKSSKEIYRILKKDGKIGISDIVVNSDIPLSIKDALYRFVCVLEANSTEEYKKYLSNAGFTNIQFYDKKQELLRLVDDIKKRIFAAELLKGLGKMEINIDLDKIKNTIKEVKECINSNTISYTLIIGDKR